MAKLSGITTPSLTFDEGAAPSTPAASKVILYAKSDGLLYSKDDAGTETVVTGGAGGAVATDAIWDAAGDLAVGTGANTAAKLTIGAAGTLPIVSAGTLAYAYAPTFHGTKAYNNTTQSMNGSGTNGGLTTLTFNAEEFDTDAYHDTGSNTSRLTIPTGLGGYYEVGCMVYGAPQSAGTTVTLYVDGAATTYHGMVVRNSASGGTTGDTWNGNWIVSLTAGQYLELVLSNANATGFNVGHASTVAYQTAFWCQLVGV